MGNKIIDITAQEVREQEIIHSSVDSFLLNAFHKLWYKSLDYKNSVMYCGIPIIKNPLDLMIIEEMLWEVRPTVIIETGTYKGGSALWFAHKLDLLTAYDAYGGKEPAVFSIDQRTHSDIPKGYIYPDHPSIHYVIGDSASSEIAHLIKDSMEPDDVIMVFLDSDYPKDHVLQEMKLYGDLVSKGSYMVVENTNIALVHPEYGPGPDSAINEFMLINTNFDVDKSRHKFGLTFNEGGFLRRK